MATAPVISQTMNFKSEAEADQYLSKMRARYRKPCDFTGAPLYKNSANVIFRKMGASIQILTNCTC